MQLMPATAAWIAARPDWQGTASRTCAPAGQHAIWEAYYLAYLLDRFDGDRESASPRTTPAPAPWALAPAAGPNGEGAGWPWKHPLPGDARLRRPGGAVSALYRRIHAGEFGEVKT